MATANTGDKPIYRVCLHGVDEAGKSKILLRFARGGYEESYTPTIHEITHMSFVVNQKEWNLELHDLAGNMHHANERGPHLSKTQAVIYVYDLTNEDTFEGLAGCYEEVSKLKGGPVPCVLVGAKSDEIKDDYDRRTPKADAEALAAKWGCPYVECSAESGDGIEEIFHKLVGQLGNVEPVVASSMKTEGLGQKLAAATAAAAAAAPEEKKGGNWDGAGEKSDKKGVSKKVTGIFKRKKKDKS